MIGMNPISSVPIHLTFRGTRPALPGDVHRVMRCFSSITSLTSTLFDPEYLGSLETNVVVPNRPNVPEFLCYGTSSEVGLKNGTQAVTVRYRGKRTPERNGG